MTGRSPLDRPIVLIVEDDDLQGTVLDLVLENAGFEVAVVDSLHGALNSIWQHGRADVIFVDTTSPSCDGFEAVRRVRRAARRTPIVALIDPGDAGAMGRAHTAGCTATLRKPVHGRTVIDLSRHLIAAARRRERDRLPVPALAGAEPVVEPVLVHAG